MISVVVCSLKRQTGLDVHRSTVHRVSADYILHTYKMMHLRAREASPALQEDFAAECWRGDLRAGMVLSVDEMHSIKTYLLLGNEKE